MKELKACADLKKGGRGGFCLSIIGGVSFFTLPPAVFIYFLYG